MALYTRCILNPPRDNCIRVSIMSRHTLNDGVTPDPRIIKSYDDHFAKLGPPAKLIGSYYKRNMPWEEFAQRYLEYINQDLIRQTEIRLIVGYARSYDIALLCIEKTPEQCHRRLLAELIKKKYPDLQVVIE